MNEVDQPALPFLSFHGPVICVVCGRGFQYGERVELRCEGPRVLPVISIDGASSYEEVTVGETESPATFNLAHRECPE